MADGVWRTHRPSRSSPCQISSKLVKPLRRYRNFSIFQDGGCPSSWICFPRLWITHEASFGGLYRCIKFG